ncbi:alpha/beta fold hydrolase [Vibrio sp. JC009]|uniref:alpha/beta fold hydrolase n=1 Tax=Vibrio sp. JC009 TaxID=2912314 RepID=UPI0023B08398|nr:alpha/beta fold hydrolase [Vibrio sp. JC009]WED22527.1 alpha/beta fold hydrolase [Vibrio sp. JC009]
MSERLNYTLQGEGQTIVLIHGLFGSLDNLGRLARDLSSDYQVLSVDLRNHGHSFHSDVHTYDVMAEDLHKIIDSLKLSGIHIIGHSMGGKVAMKYAADHPENLAGLTVMDMAPVNYPQNRHDNVFAGLAAVLAEKPAHRSEALAVLAQHVEIEGVRQFLGKSLYKTEGYFTWRFNVAAIKENYRNILGWAPVPECTIPTLFLKGANSDYLLPEYQNLIRDQFPNSKAHIIANTGHWLHAEKPQEVIRAIRRFIINNSNSQ